MATEPHQTAGHPSTQHQFADESHVDLLQPGGCLTELAAIKLLWVRNETNYRASLYELLARTYRLSHYLKKDPDSYLEFCRQEYWKNRRLKPNIERPEECLRFLVHQIVADDNEDGERNKSRKRVYDYLSALREVCHRNISSDQVADTLQEFGITRLAEAFANRRTKGAKKQSTPRGRVQAAKGSAKAKIVEAPRITIANTSLSRKLRWMKVGEKIKALIRILESDDGHITIKLTNLPTN